MKKFISIFKASKVEELYVYVDRVKGIASLPEELQEKLGKTIHVTDMILEPTRKMARADAKKVLQQIEEKGFYLQMPPAKEEYLLDLYRDTSAKYQGLD